MKKCFKVVVDCQKNDEVDIKCGGPEYLGYDFYVDPEIVTEMMEYIQETCKELNVPIINIYFDCSKYYNKKDFWTKEKIYECIENNEAGLNFNAISL